MKKTDKTITKTSINKKVFLVDSQKTYRTIRKIFLSSPIHRGYTMLGLTLVVIILIVFFVILPTITTIQKRRSQIVSLESDHYFLQERISMLINLEKEYNANSDGIDLLEKVFPSSINNSIMVTILNNLAIDENVELRNFSFSKDEARDIGMDSLDVYGVNITLASMDIQYLLNYIEELEKLPMSPSVDSVLVTKDSYSDGYVCSIRLKTVFIKGTFSLSETENEE